MKELSRHIESLLLDHNCVIVPHLGGFVTQYMPARKAGEGDFWLPPCRTIGFNPQLSLNDGLLVQSYMSATAATYGESVRLIDAAVARLKQRLQEAGVYEIKGVGQLKLKLDGCYAFEPVASGLVSPNLYGLAAFTCPELEEYSTQAADKAAQAKKVSRFRLIKRTGSYYTITIHRELANYVSAAVVALLFYFMWAVPGSDTTSLQNAASVVQSGIVAPKSSAPAIAQHPASALQPISEPTVAPAPADGAYTIVLAAAVPQKNVQPFVEMLAREGYPGAEPATISRMLHIVYGHFPTEGEAYKRLAELRSSSPRFREAWVKKLR
ncbi:MAG: SPOR domain-containing protein [Alloprevotella sp.]|nr:SPOR domain-containing protein [Alloprevotella sp.]